MGLNKRPGIRIMTYNIHRWAGGDRRLDVERLASIIAAAGADVVGLNEVLHPVTIGGRTWEPLTSLAERLNMFYAFGPSGWSDYGPGWHGPLGNALLSRYPLTEVANHQLPRFAGSKARSLLGTRLVGGPAAGLTAFVTHLDHAFEGTRLVQIRAVLDRLANYGPHFVCGDFNTPGFTGPRASSFRTPVLQHLYRAGYRDAFDVVGVGAGHTFPAWSPFLRIDFLFFPSRWAHGLRAAHTLAVDSVSYASDHRPVVADWSWPELHPVCAESLRRARVL